MSDDVERLLLAAVREELFGLLIVGDEAAAGGLLRRLVGALGPVHAIGAARDAEGWPSAGGTHLRLVQLEGELTPVAVLRAALRQDPDVVLLEARQEELPVELLCAAAQTGHGVLVRVAGAADEAGLLAALAPVPFAAETFRRIVVLDAKGVARLVETGRGQPVWRRGDPLPDLAVATGRTPRVVQPPAPREPVPPLDRAPMEALRALLGPHVRPTWAPVLGESEAEAGSSTIGGRPLLGPGEAWPTCGECQAAMPLAVQLAREGLPAEAQARFPGGVTTFQLFYCTHGSCAVRDPAGPDSKNKLLRFVTGGSPAAEVPALDQPVAARAITGWERRFESPDGEEVRLEDEVERSRGRLAQRRQDGDADDEEAALAGPRHGEKLLGWPAWAQGAEWERCPRCQARMELLFQVDADDAPLNMLFAADGLGHVMQCAAHLDQLRFRWACG